MGKKVLAVALSILFFVSPCLSSCKEQSKTDVSYPDFKEYMRIVTSFFYESYSDNELPKDSNILYFLFEYMTVFPSGIDIENDTKHDVISVSKEEINRLAYLLLGDVDFNPSNYKFGKTLLDSYSDEDETYHFCYAVGGSWNYPYFGENKYIAFVDDALSLKEIGNTITASVTIDFYENRAEITKSVNLIYEVEKISDQQNGYYRLLSMKTA